MPPSNRREIRSDTRVSPRRHNAIIRRSSAIKKKKKKKKKIKVKANKDQAFFGNFENFPNKNFASKNYIEVCKVAKFLDPILSFPFFLNMDTYNLLIYLFTYSLISLSIYLLSLIIYL